MRRSKSGGPRPADTYRGARRNAVLHTKPKGVWEGVDTWLNKDGSKFVKYLPPPPVRPNRRDWARLGPPK